MLAGQRPSGSRAGRPERLLPGHGRLRRSTDTYGFPQGSPGQVIGATSSGFEVDLEAVYDDAMAGEGQAELAVRRLEGGRARRSRTSITAIRQGARRRGRVHGLRAGARRSLRGRRAPLGRRARRAPRGRSHARRGHHGQDALLRRESGGQVGDSRRASSPTAPRFVVDRHPEARRGRHRCTRVCSSEGADREGRRATPSSTVDHDAPAARRGATTAPRICCTGRSVTVHRRAGDAEGLDGRARSASASISAPARGRSRREELERIEDLVNGKILENAPIETEVLPIAEAKDKRRDRHLRGEVRRCRAHADA